MSFLDLVTPVIITWNEELNVRRVFDQLAWARDVVVVDSGSTDATLQLLSVYPNVRIISNPFRSHQEQWNHAVSATSITTDWILTLDADYVLDDTFLREMSAIAPVSSVSAYAARFVYMALGRPLRGSLYPPRVVLFRRGRGHFEQDGHAQRLIVEGGVSTLNSPIYHDDRKPFSRWVANQERYAALEAQKLHSASSETLGWVDRVRLVGFVAPALVAPYCLLLRGCALDGRAGLHYTLQRVVAEALLSIRLLELRARATTPSIDDSL